MSKSVWKAAYVDLSTIKTLSSAQQKQRKMRSIMVWSKASVITPGMIGLTVEVYDGRKHVPVYITDTKVGYKFGHFITTRTFRSHIKKDRRNKR